MRAFFAGPSRASSVLALAILAAACDRPGEAGATSAASIEGADDVSEAAADEAVERARQERIEREFPLHGLVTGTQLVVRKEAAPESEPVGWLRVGSRVRLARDKVDTPTCATGWYPVYPRGYVCAGQGVQIGEQPPSADFVVDPPAAERALPYRYYFVKEPMVPEYHRTPSRDEQRAALAYAERYLEILATDERRAARMLAGELPNEPPKPTVVMRYLDRGFFLAVAAVEVRAQRRFVRTVRGTYVKEAQLEERTGSSFHGVEVDDAHPLPIVFALRSGRLLIKRDREDGTMRFVEDEEAPPIERHTLVSGWVRRQRLGEHVMHVMEGDRYLKHWFLGVAEKIDPPFRVEDDEPWVHVDLSEQTVVVYRGTRPVYATLASTGLAGFETPVGTFTIRGKLISDTMANLGPEAGDDRYRIEDVPWTQYFEGSVALHAAFWHGQFGMPRSHGCVNLAPADAHRIFSETWPRVPEGWHGASTDRTGFPASRVVVTE